MEKTRLAVLQGIDRLQIYDSSEFIIRQCSQLKEFLRNKSKIGDIYKLLYELLLLPDYTNIIMICFQKLVLQILNENIQMKITKSGNVEIECEMEKQQIHRKNCVALSKLLNHPDILQFSVYYFDIYPSPFEWQCGNENVLKKRKMMNWDSTITDTDIVGACYKFLCTHPNVFRSKWKWSKFINQYIHHNEFEIKWLCCQCIGILSGMSEFQLDKLKNTLISDSNLLTKYTIKYLHSNSYSIAENNSSIENCTNENDDTSNLNDYVIDISGIFLPIYDTKHRESGFLVDVKSTLDNLRSLALAIVSGKAVCLTGPVGCGKTALVEHLAALTGRKKFCFKKVQLGDQTDSRSLLGTYRCTDIPGEFVWQPGVLTQAVQQGHWLLLEDIDCAAIDIASVLSSLLERNMLSVPGYRDSIPINPGFQLFVTKRIITSSSGNYKHNSNTIMLLEKHLIQISVEPLSRSELIMVVEQLFPKLKTISSRIVDVFLLFSSGKHHTSLQNLDKDHLTSPLLENLPINISEILSFQSGRLTSTRDLIKWCSRAIMDFDISSSESALKVLQDAIDIFACSLPDNNSRIALATTIGAYLGIVESKSEYFCTTYKPKINLNPDYLHIGRAVIHRKHLALNSINLNEKKVVFSFTRQSLCLLERISCCVNMNEPILLVGETGTGKTSSVQYLARETGNKLVVINMNQQSDSADLLGGYKPVDLKYLVLPVKNQFEYLFRNYFDVAKNVKFLEHISNSFYINDWKILIALMKQSQLAAVKRLQMSNDKSNMLQSWINLGTKLNKLEAQIKSKASLAFSFIEGSLINALKEGHWVLLDEINLASAETLECLSGLLENQNSSINLFERGDDEPIKRHKNFVLFACMNPATDVGKKELPAGLRNRFTEFFVDELSDKNDFLLLISDYLKEMAVEPTIVESIYKFFLNIQKEAKLTLMDGTGQSPYYSLRTLCRALFIAPTAYCGTLSRSLYETMCLSFLTQLDNSSHPKVENMIANAVLGKKTLKSVLKQPIPKPKNESEMYLNFEGYWICQGKLKPEIIEDYILTSSVRKNLRDLVRIISLGNLPVLLQGDTSVGKTSLITYLAKASGNFCVRINNHQHTDLQEYIGSYATDSSGKLIFKEGVLVEAMRKGYWIILDELNLAPSDVLEALNRVLDDNRELFIPETQQTIKADRKFMLFATQNPPGLYGGRNLLSRAFRNRFVELHFDEIPKNELEIILHQRCHMPISYCKKVLSVMTELQIRRRGSAAIQGKQGFITLRDLFRWGERYKIASNHDTLIGKYYDWDQHIADEGYLILAGKVRQPEERVIIQEVIQQHIKRNVNPDNLFSLHDNTSSVTRDILEVILHTDVEQFKHIVWTFNMRRLAVMVSKAFHFKEPVLLVGETGCGKTTICQIISFLRKTELTCVNCHMHTESSDFLGGLRPVRHHNDNNKLFEWVDGPLIKTMNMGGVFLADEISLADDSVLERLNSLLEPERQILLSEKGICMEKNSVYVVQAVNDFRFIGTMNPGGDYGKKELSPALRNRFTEIWCDNITLREDFISVLKNNLVPSLRNVETMDISESIYEFVEWFKKTKVGERFSFSIRDLLSWINFINVTIKNIDLCEAYLHGAALVFLDCLSANVSGIENEGELVQLKKLAVEFLTGQFKNINNCDITHITKLLIGSCNLTLVAQRRSEDFGIEPFFIKFGSHDYEVCDQFNFTAPTTGLNTLKLLRGLQLNKAILLEGSPGVGKTSLVTALAKKAGHRVCRINLSDQTDISDLFGADLPTEEGGFTWHNGVFLTALQNGDWILLDELNLAPQPVLEGLNACLDHRGEIFIPELNRTFAVKSDTRIFACQNPLQQGGARKGLPKSFLNRFTQVYIDTLTSDDLLFIVTSQFPTISSDVLMKIIKFNSQILNETSSYLWGFKGSPWEFNLRDIQRWCEAIIEDYKNVDIADCYKKFSPGKVAKVLYIDRMRTEEDKNKVKLIYNNIFSSDYPLSNDFPKFHITREYVHVGNLSLKRNIEGVNEDIHSDKKLLVLRSQLSILKSLIQCVKMNWLTILVGPTASGKSNCVQVLSQLVGSNLKILPVTSAMDTADILGGFEQTDYNRHMEDISDKINKIILFSIHKLSLLNDFKNVVNILHQWETFQHFIGEVVAEKHTAANETRNYIDKLNLLRKILESLTSLGICDNDSMDVIIDVEKKIEKIRATIENERTVNTSGKFEWVDSLLIKCLLDGSWLLIDNVNFCSSAILDRLNCLFEPNGFLSIAERGDSSTEIKPHPNFRIFFTMDPKNGEISRAMRNRGVEIYMLGAEDAHADSLTNKMPILDLEALLNSTGIPKSLHYIFLSSHDLMCSFIHSHEKPTQFHLLQAAFLSHQQLTRGIPVLEAIINGFSDVYIKPRMISDFIESNKSLAECKNSMLKNLKGNVDKNKNSISLEMTTSLHTFSCNALSYCIGLEKSKQDAYALCMSLKKKTDAFNQDVTYKTSALIYNYYTHSTFNDINFRFEYINQHKCNTEISIWCNNVNKILYEAVSTLFKNSDEEYPFNSELLPEIYDIKGKVSTSFVNRFYGYLYVLIVIMQRNFKTNNPCVEMNMLTYSQNVFCKKMPDQYSEFPLLKYCSYIISKFDDLFKNLLLSVNFELSDNMWSKLILNFYWTNRFFNACHLPLFKIIKKGSKKLKSIEEDSILSLSLHYKWIIKRLFKPFIKSHIKILSDELDDILNEIERSLITYKSPFKMVCKQINTMIGRSSLYLNDENYKMCMLRNNFFDNCFCLKILKRNFTKNDIMSIEKEAKYFDMELLSGSNVFGHPQVNFLEKSNAIYMSYMPICENNAHSDGEAYCHFTYKCQLWPIEDFILQKVLHPYKVRLFESFLKITKKNCGFNMVTEDAGLKYNKLINYLRLIIKNCDFLPPKLKCIIFNAELEFSSLLECSLEIWNLFSEFQDISPCSYGLYWLYWNANLLTVDKDDYEAFNVKTLSMNFPHITHNTIKLTLCTNSENDIATPLFGWKERSKQLSSLQNLLSHNLIITSMFEFNHIIQEAKMITMNFERTVICLKTILYRKIKKHDETFTIPHGVCDDNILQTVDDCINMMNYLYEFQNIVFTTEMIEFKNNFNLKMKDCAICYTYLKETNCSINNCDKFVLNVGKMFTLYSFLNLSIFTNIDMIDTVKKNKMKINYLQEDLKIIDSLLEATLLQNVIQGAQPIDYLNNISKWEPIACDGFNDDTNKTAMFEIINETRPFSSLLEIREDISLRLTSLLSIQNYRPTDPTYEKLSKEILYFVNSIGSYKMINNHYQNMINTQQKLQNVVKDASVSLPSLPSGVLDDVNNVINAYSSWRVSIKIFYSNISKKFNTTFPDIIGPFLHSINQLLFGLDIIKDYLVKFVTGLIYVKDDETTIDAYSQNLLKFPIFTNECDDVLSLISLLSSKKFEIFLNNAKLDNNMHEKNVHHSILKICLREIYCKIVVDNALDSINWNLLNSILSEIVAKWQVEQDSKEKKKQEDDSLYVTKTKCDEPTDEEQIEIDLKNIYPSFIDTDFADFKIGESNRSENPQSTVKKSSEEIFTSDDISLIATIHSNIVKNYTKAEWLQKTHHNKLKLDYLTPLIERYKIFGLVFDNIVHGLNEMLDRKTLSSLLVLISYTKSSIDGEDYLENNSNIINNNNNQNFYTSSWISEARTCLPTLESIKSKTLVLLEQWPDFPTLKDIIIIINRILNFSITSPLVRFLTGLELLRDKMEEWNKNAHQGNNMIDLSLLVAQHIISWRKIEMTNWKNNLNCSFQRLECEGNKWWFHIYTLLECFVLKKPIIKFESDIITNDDLKLFMDSHAFTTAMKEFIEKSPIVEFKKRLDILYTFHCHAVNMKQSSSRDDAISILWNVYKFYSQYSTHVEQIIKTKRAPIEKKLRDFVKICTWDRDLSYWAVKDLTYKTHKTLHKHVKEFEECLQAGVYNYLTLNKLPSQISNSLGIWDRPKRSNVVASQYKIDSSLYVVSSKKSKKYFSENSNSEGSVIDFPKNSLCAKLETLTFKAKDICSSIISNSSYPDLLQSLDNITTTMIETVEYLGSLKSPSNLPKEKQKSLEKSYLQQKRKGLTDLFQYLTKIGISYKAGLMKCSLEKGKILDFKIPPIDLESTFSYLENKHCDASLLSVWQGCELYYHRCAIQISTLNISLLKPSPQLDLQIIERIKGFAFNFMEIVQKQKKEMCKNSREISTLRYNLEKISECGNFQELLYDNSESVLHLNKLLNVYLNIIMTMEQFSLVLKALPAHDDTLTERLIMFDKCITNNAIFNLKQNDSTWSQMIAKVKCIIDVTLKQRDQLIKIKSTLPLIIKLNKTNPDHHLCLFSPQLEIINNSINCLRNIMKDINSLTSYFNDDENLRHNIMYENPIIESVIYLKKSIELTLTEIQPDMSEYDEKIESSSCNLDEKFVQQIEDLTSFLLLKIQDMYKKNLDSLPSTECNNHVNSACDSVDDMKYTILENHLKVKLVENITNNISVLCISQFNLKCNSIIKKLISLTNADFIIYKKHLYKVVPLLEQFTFLAQFFLMQEAASYRLSCKMLSIMLNTFVELSEKGFCASTDVEQEMGEGKGPGNLAGGMGLADGEGEKDVSEQIENQDQLDDAKKAGDENKNEEDRDCKEEANGIDMTDDFESHLQDVENNSENEQSDNDDNIEKDMGKTDNGADQLDQQMWGLDDVEDESDNKEEDNGKGESTGEKQMEAKEDNSNENDKGEPNYNDEKKNKNDINELNEPDYDDNQIDPYHKNQKPLPEPEPLELPDDINADNDENDNEQTDENKDPFEINVMKDKNPVDDSTQQKNSEDEDLNKDNDSAKSDSSDETDEENNANESADNKKENNEINDDEMNKENHENKDSEETCENENEEKNPSESFDQVSEIEKENSPSDEAEDSKTEDECIEGQKSFDRQKYEEDNIENSTTEKGSKDAVKNNPEIDKHEESAPNEQSQEQDGEDQQGYGHSELKEKQTGHSGKKKEKPQTAEESVSENKRENFKQQNKPGNIEEDRVLGEVKEAIQNKNKTLNIQNNDEKMTEDEGLENNLDTEAELYQHIKEAKKIDSQVIDTASKEQAEQQSVVDNPREENTKSPDLEDEIQMNISEDEDVEMGSNTVESEKFENSSKKNTASKQSDNVEDVEDTNVEVEGENIVTLGAKRESTTTFHTNLENMREMYNCYENTINTPDIRKSMQTINSNQNILNNSDLWQELWGKTSSQARLLTEKLRLVLEPTGLSRLAGDFRTGKRINMRRIIPYIASHFRKDRIWLRRTRPAKREYHIAVAIDDSSSMCDNQSKELAFESLALISQALNILEAGDLAVLSFGEDTKIIHSFNEQFTEKSGHKIIQYLTFKQTRTRIAHLVEFATAMFQEICSHSKAPNAKLLLVVSDGRSVFSEGESKVVQSIRKARHHGVFIVYLIIDNPSNEASIMDIKVPKFDPTTFQLTEMKPYLDSFPFPFYLILRDMTALPSVLSDAMRQWFELAANIDK